MRYCQRCLYPENHPLNITFDDQGVCSGCRIHEEKDSLNWEQRAEKLGKLLCSYRNQSGKNYDCIIPVRGARDSYFIVHTIKKVYGLNPLLVTYNKQYNTAVGIRNLAYLRTIFDCDLLTMTVAPETVKKITRASLDKLGSIYWHCLAGQTVFPVQIAVRFKIPLIVWGAHQGCDQVGMFSHEDEVEMTRKYRKDHDLMGLEAEDMVAEQFWLNHQDLLPYKYPHDKDIERVGVRGIYLNNYIRWDTKAQHEAMMAQYGYESFEQTRTFDTYNDVDCFNYSDVHDYIKYLKWGYGKATDHACREIRLKRMTREQGVSLVQSNQKKPQNLNQFLAWLGITQQGFYYFMNKHRDQAIWFKNDANQWLLRDKVTAHHDGKIERARLQQQEAYRAFLQTQQCVDTNKKYILIGRGWADQ